MPQKSRFFARLGEISISVDFLAESPRRRMEENQKRAAVLWSGLFLGCSETGITLIARLDDAAQSIRFDPELLHAARAAVAENAGDL